MNKLIIFCLALLSFLSCGNRNPNLSEKQLLALVTDAVLPEPEVEPTPNLTTPEGYVPQAGVKYRQKRDLSVPPVRIEILKGIDDVRHVTLSRIAKDIEYVNIGNHRFGAHVKITPHGLLISNNDGVWLYSFEGKQIKQIYKNQHGLKIEGNIVVDRGEPFIGITNLMYDEKDDRLWFQYENSRETTYLAYMDMREMLLQTENRETGQDPVTLLAPFKSGRMSYSRDYIIHKAWNNSMFTTFSFQGDTLCRFNVGYDSITVKATRGIFVDAGNDYMYRGMYTFRNSFSDTLFRVTAVNKLKPEYLLDVGTSGRATNRGKKSDVHIDLMYIVQQIKEDDRYLYIKFSKNYDCPANRSSQKVRFWWGLYDKAKNEFFTLPFISDSNPDVKGFENDIDGGIPFWPTQIGERGEKIAQTFGKQFKEQLSPAWFSQSKALDSQKKEKLVQFVKTLKDDDRVIIIVK